jgi:iron complex outermembrane recepter protein
MHSARCTVFLLILASVRAPLVRASDEVPAALEHAASEQIVVVGTSPLPGSDGPVYAADIDQDEDEGIGTLPGVTVQGARDVVPSEALLDRGSPQSIVNERVIHEIASPVGDFGTVANFTPSFVSSAPNGPGFDAAKSQTLRGFVDGQFNVTMDGIPFADPDSFAHHSTSYFPVSMLDHLIIDRSPGAAPDLGYASFGGSVNLFSESIPDQARARAYASYGSFNTSLIGTTVNTESPQTSGRTGLLATIEYSHSDGAMSYSPGDKDDVLLKSVSLLGDVRLTALYTYDRYHFYNPGNITAADLASYGSSYGYNNDPGTANYYGYSATERSSDFGYVKVESLFAGSWGVEDRLYTYSYDNTGLSLKGDQTSSPVGSGFPGISPTDIAGRTSYVDYRTVGNDLRVNQHAPSGTVLFGLWAEHSWQNASRLGLDLTTGMPYDANKKAHSPVNYAFDAHLNTLQPYAEYAWQTTEDLRVRFGLRYRDVTRDFDASVIQNFLPGTSGQVSKTVHSTLPSIDAAYRLGEESSVFAQVSKGSLVPSQSFFYTSNPTAGNQVDPETSTAVQLGVVRQTTHYGIGFDVYNINFDNYVSTIVQNGDTLYVNSGSVRYRGVETEGHVNLGLGVTAVANASLIRATFQQSGMTSPIEMAGDTIPYAPSYTGLLGLVYGQGPWGASLLTKFVGTEYQGKNGSADGGTYRVNAYSYTNATVTRNLIDWLGAQRVRLTFAINNLWNSDAITDNAGPSIAAPNSNLLNVLARRNYMISVVADL